MMEYDRRQKKLFVQFRELWHGMAMMEFRASLKAMVSTPSNKKFKGEEGKAFPSNPISE